MVSPLRINPARIRRGLAFTSSIIFAMYSPTSPTAKRLMAPKNNEASNSVVTPLGAISGIHKRSAMTIKPRRIDSPSKTIPPAESNFSGALLNEKMPRFAHSRFFRRLFVLSPNMRFGRT